MNRQISLFYRCHDAGIGITTSAAGHHKMSISAQSIISFSNFKRNSFAKGAFALAALVFTAGMVSPASAGPRPGAFDGNWYVTFTTRAGNCSSTNSAPFYVSGTRVSSAGGGKVTGGVRPSGALAVNISLGLSHARGTGRLSGRSGAGRWSGVISGDRCSGTWVATKT
jgi:hypothetical protein